MSSLEIISLGALLRGYIGTYPTCSHGYPMHLWTLLDFPWVSVSNCSTYLSSTTSLLFSCSGSSDEVEEHFKRSLAHMKGRDSPCSEPVTSLHSQTSVKEVGVWLGPMYSLLVGTWVCSCMHQLPGVHSLLLARGVLVYSDYMIVHLDAHICL